MGTSGETTVFEHMSVVILGQDGMCDKGNDLRNVLIHCDQRITSSQIGTCLSECLFESKKYLDHFSLQTLYGLEEGLRLTVMTVNWNCHCVTM